MGFSSCSCLNMNYTVTNLISSRLKVPDWLILYYKNISNDRLWILVVCYFVLTHISHCNDHPLDSYCTHMSLWFQVALMSFGAYVLSSPDHILDARRAFVSLSLFNLITFPMSILPGVIATMVQVRHWNVYSFLTMFPGSILSWAIVTSFLTGLFVITVPMFILPRIVAAIVHVVRICTEC